MVASPRPIVFSDLDDTLLQSHRRIALIDAPDAVQVSSGIDGNRAYMTRRQKALFDWLRATTEFVPVTARGIAAFGDLTLDFGGLYRIVANGAVVIDPDGSHDIEWTMRMSDDMAPYQAVLADLLERGTALSGSLGIDVHGRLSEERGMRISALFSENDGDGQALARLRPIFERLDGWTLHHNGNMLAATPPSVSKKRAVEYVLSKLSDSRHRPVFGFGDSLSDLGFMADCDFITVPRESQIGAGILS